MSDFLVEKMSFQVRPQPKPIHNLNEPDIVDLVMKDFEEYRQYGIFKYGTPLQAHNGRDPLIDLYQELIAATNYTRQLIKEKYGE